MIKFLTNKTPADIIKQGEEIFKYYKTTAERAEKIISIWESAGLMELIKSVSVYRLDNFFEIKIDFKEKINVAGDIFVNTLTPFNTLVKLNLADYNGGNISDGYYISACFRIK